jgi:hypothetical protein
LRALLVTFAVAAVLVALLFERPHATPGPPMRDFEAYYAAGALWQHGQWPYGTAIWNVEKTIPGVSPERYEVLPYAGPPALLPVLSAVARMPLPTANDVWRTFLVVGLALLALATLRLSGNRITVLSVLTIAVAALGFGPLTSALALGQIVLPAFVFALPLYRGYGALFAWAQPNVAMALISKPRTFITSGVVFVIACLAVVGFDGALSYARVLHDHGSAERFSAIQITPAAIAYGFGAPEHLALAIGITVTIASVAAWILIMLRVRDTIARFCATCALLPLAMPFFHEHDLLVAFVPAVVYTLRARGGVLPLALLGALLCATDWLGLAQRPDGLAQTLLLIAAFGAALVALRKDLNPRMLLVPLGVLLTIGLAGWFSQAHPAPVWPDAMGALPDNVRALSVSAAWHAEQAATGLFQRNAFWALLRCGSLAGCVLLVCAVVRTQFEIDCAFQKSMTGPGLIPRKSSL